MSIAPWWCGSIIVAKSWSTLPFMGAAAISRSILVMLADIARINPSTAEGIYATAVSVTNSKAAIHPKVVLYFTS
jgi:hypothetical protein